MRSSEQLSLRIDSCSYQYRVDGSFEFRRFPMLACDMQYLMNKLSIFIKSIVGVSFGDGWRTCKIRFFVFLRLNIFLDTLYGGQHLGQFWW